MWAGGYFTGQHQLIIQEVIDGVMDTLFGLIGVLLVIYLGGRINSGSK